MVESGPGIPDDFGLSPVQTLARVGDPSPASDHSIVWRTLKNILHTHRPALTERVLGGEGVAAIDPSDETATHAYESVPVDPESEDLPRVRIGARLLTPPAGVTPVAGVVSSHGYAVSKSLAERDDLFSNLTERGVAVLNIRIRGYAGSRLDTGNWQVSDGTAANPGWMARGLNDERSEPSGALAWSYVQGVADLINGVRALRWWIEDRIGTMPKMMLHGESFGGGLAVVAASVLTGRERPRTWLDRLVIGLPTMGDWPWRLSEPQRCGRGSGQEVRDALDRVSDERRVTIRRRLRMADAVVHAARIRCPVLCKLAERDEVVPAPTAGAVFNAIGSDPGQKWRFIVPHGHAETGLANARRHVEFDRLMHAFLEPTREPAEGINAWHDLKDQPQPETHTQTGLFGDGEDASPDARDVALVEAYQKAARTLDDLPYTDEFESIWSAAGEPAGVSRRDTFHRLHTLRKAGKLPRMGKAEGRAVKLLPEEEERLSAMIIESAGALGKRDRLPFTTEFDDMLESFNAKTGRNLARHELWRVIAKLAK